MSADPREKQLEAVLAAEEKNDAYNVTHAIKDLAASQKALARAERAQDKAVHTKEKLVGKEHKTSKKLSQATAAHDQALLAEEKAERDIEIKVHHQSQLEQDVTERKAALDNLQSRKEANDETRGIQKMASIRRTVPSLNQGHPGEHPPAAQPQQPPAAQPQQAAFGMPVPQPEAPPLPPRAAGEQLPDPQPGQQPGRVPTRLRPGV